MTERQDVLDAVAKLEAKTDWRFYWSDEGYWKGYRRNFVPKLNGPYLNVPHQVPVSKILRLAAQIQEQENK